MLRHLLLCLFVGSSFPALAFAQDEGSADSLETEARAVFEAGSTAFADARYEDALGYFRRAFELSNRPELLFNIGVAADRLRRDAEALEAFERFLAEVPDHPRRRDAEARVTVLRPLVERGESGETTESDPTATSETTATTATAGTSSGPDVLSIVGASTLGALGLAGVVAAIVGMAGGQCLEMAGSTCVEERGPNWVGVGVYGGLGLASIAGAIIWLVVASSGGAPADAPVALTPNGLAFTWSL